ncbi:hypothetical protein FDI43_gp34 [Streptomyces phage DrGrey]|uniref:Uncharacterized protein n=4 Tax=Rimavirus drgrey TaxID=2560783 RepID=A0A223LHQ8_9CAUD|nr:hypothetical protein FDI43_gp34 [Streptomyces phage DrGrey]ASU03947.1 hypothetical protein SEA_DRGREY_34 [Streptomyces phage DrGrey]
MRPLTEGLPMLHKQILELTSLQMFGLRYLDLESFEMLMGYIAHISEHLKAGRVTSPEQMIEIAVNYFVDNGTFDE